MLKVKLLALLLPVCLIAGGCGAKTEPVADTSTNVATAPEDTANEAAPPVVEPTKTYTLSDPASTGLPPEAVEALKKEALPPPPASMPTPKEATLLFTTSKGTIKVQLNGKEAPLEVKSFVYLTQKGFYNSTIFHRYADLMEGSGNGQKGRIIQGGDPLTKNPKLKQFWGAGGPGYEVPREHNNLTHEAFVIAAARSSDPDSAGSQFYFTVDPVPFLDQGDGYTVFGKVLSGKDVVSKLRAGDKLEKVEVLSETKSSAKPK
ncbi:MAG: peptidylprolyl isomerase [Abditibacteriaceae bacterium]